MGRQQRRQLNRSARAAVGTLLAAAALGTGSAGAAGPPPPLAPDFALKSTGGENVRLAEFRGQPVLLAFWAEWCATCNGQLAELAGLAARYAGEDLVVLTVNIDDAGRREAAASAAARHGLTVLRDDAKAVARAYDLGTLPVTLLIDPDGRIRGTWERYRPDTTREVEAGLARVLAE